MPILDPFYRFHRPGLVLLMLSCLGAAVPLSAQTVPLRGATQVSAGGAHTCAIVGSGAMCWGLNSAGQLGDGGTTDHYTPMGVTGLAGGVTAISAGAEYTCAVIAGGAVKCWGLDYYGQLGDGSGAFGVVRLIPTSVSGLSSGVASISAGYAHTCAVTTGGAVKCWGRNSRGQLGDGSTTNRLVPVDVSGLASGVAAVSVGEYHTCALTTGGGVKCWGGNDYGQLGDGSTTDRLVPVNVSGLTSGVAGIGTGDLHTCALTTGGAAKCWGDNGNGQLGDGTTTTRLTPVNVSGLASGVAAIRASANYDHSCALTTDGRVRCWGDFYFPIGGIFPVASTVPVDQGVSGAVAISAGGAGFVVTAHACSLAADGSAKCWGGNKYGQLGNGSAGAYSGTPGDVVLPEVVFSNGFE